jgi:hypothetical protein
MSLEAFFPAQNFLLKFEKVYILKYNHLIVLFRPFGSMNGFPLWGVASEFASMA